MLFPNIDLNDEIQNLIQNLTHWKLLKDQVYLKFNKRPSISFLLLPNVSSDSHLSNSKVVIQVNLHPLALVPSSFSTFLALKRARHFKYSGWLHSTTDWWLFQFRCPKSCSHPKSVHIRVVNHGTNRTLGLVYESLNRKFPTWWLLSTPNDLGHI